MDAEMQKETIDSLKEIHRLAGDLLDYYKKEKPETEEIKLPVDTLLNLAIFIIFN